MDRPDSGSGTSQGPGSEGGGSGSQNRSEMGLVAATALVMGSVVGTGVFMLPAAFAPFGPISLAGFALAAIGATTLALTFGALARRIPAQGGPYAYALAAFGPFSGFSAAWFYWITAWVSRAGMIVGWITYVQAFVNQGGNRWLSILIGLIGLWVPAWINLSGIKNMVFVQVTTTFLKFIPLVAISTVGLFFVDWASLKPFNLSGGTPRSAIVACMALAVFAYIGVETASVAAGRVRNPRRNVPLASLLGTLACSVVYLLSTLVIMGTVSNAALSRPDAQPFVLSFDAILGGTWSGYLVAVAAVISGFGACTGWTMVCAEMSKAAADEGLFPKRFAVQSAAGVPAFGIIVSTLLSTLLLVVSYLGQAGGEVFRVVILLAGLSVAVPYLLSALALIKLSGGKKTRSESADWRLDGAIATVAAAFSVLVVRGALVAPGTRVDLLVFAAVAWAVGIAIYFGMRRVTG